MCGIGQATPCVSRNARVAIYAGGDWAAAWALDDNGWPIATVSSNDEHQRELAFRFGINLVMYTLTGSYKADQVHLPAIMERLGE